MARFLYNILSVLFVLPMLVSLYRPKADQPKFGSRWREHFGLGEGGTFDIWVHAVSVGEVVAIAPLIRELKSQQPHLRILLTTTTATGAQQVEKLLGKQVEHRYAPLDFWPCVWLFFSRYQFSQYWIMETELWPNSLAFARNKRIKTCLINARMSERSSNRYAKLKFASISLFSMLDLVLAQTQDDAARFKRLGAKQVVCSGSIKFDLPEPEAWLEKSKTLKTELFGQRPLWVIASSHEPEESQLLSLVKLVQSKSPESLCIWVPRHPQRFSQVAASLTSEQISFCQRSKGQLPSDDTQVYLADSMGEMMLWYAMADVAFIGGSLSPVGGHNYLEAAAVATPCVAGPYDFNFSQISKQLQQVEHLYLDSKLSQLSGKIVTYLQDPKLSAKHGHSGLQIVQQNRGALTSSLKQLLQS